MSSQVFSRNLTYDYSFKDPESTLVPSRPLEETILFLQGRIPRHIPPSMGHVLDYNISLPQSREKAGTPSREVLATAIQEGILQVSKTANYSEQQYLDYASFLRKEIVELSLNPESTQKRISRTRDRFSVPKLDGEGIISCPPLRACWISKSTYNKYVDLQMIHSGPEALVGRGSFKKVKLSTNYRIPLNSAEKASRIFSQTTVLVRVSSEIPTFENPPSDTSPEGFNRWINKIEEHLSEHPYQVLRQAQETEADIESFRQSVQIAGLGDMRRNLFDVPKKIIAGLLKINIQKKKLEMEERHFSGDFFNLQNLLSTPEKIQILLDSAKNLVKLHEHRIIHRDVKGVNILIDSTGETSRGFLADFDLKSSGGMSNISSAYPYWDSATRRGFVTRAADIYGLAMTIGDCIIGNHFDGFRDGQTASEDPQLSFGKKLKTILIQSNTGVSLDQIEVIQRLGSSDFKAAASNLLILHLGLFTEVLKTPGHPYHEGHSLKDIEDLHHSCQILLHKITKTSKYPEGPILEIEPFNKLLTICAANIAIKSFQKIEMYGLSDEIHNLFLSKKLTQPCEQITQIIDRAVSQSGLTKEVRVVLKNLRGEIIAVTKLHQLINDVVQGNQVLLRLLENQTQLEVDDIESCFPSMKEIYHRIEDIQKDVVLAANKTP
ncbi:MAG: serine/threonine protein kinase [Chlamydiales bacterium]|jgi:serine/threonine protein kinase